MTEKVVEQFEFEVATIVGYGGLHDARLPRRPWRYLAAGNFAERLSKRNHHTTARRVCLRATAKWSVMRGIQKPAKMQEPLRRSKTANGQSNIDVKY